jgi:hypothetical protein
MEANQPVIEGAYTVEAERLEPVKPKREPIIGSWKALFIVAGVVLLKFLSALYRHH